MMFGDHVVDATHERTRFRFDTLPDGGMGTHLPRDDQCGAGGIREQREVAEMLGIGPPTFCYAGERLVPLVRPMLTLDREPDVDEIVVVP